MIGHLGSRVSALLDGRLPAGEEERAWEHVHACHPCRDLVEREGWVKTRLAGMTCAPVGASEAFKHHLMSAASLAGCPPDDAPAGPPVSFLVRHRAVAALGSGALGVAVLGVAALSAVPTSSPQFERRAPVTSLVRPAATPTVQVVSGRTLERTRRTRVPQRRAGDLDQAVNSSVQSVSVPGKMAP